MTPSIHYLLVALNIISISLILVNGWIAMFSHDVKPGAHRNIFIFNILLGLVVRVSALTITMVILRSNYV